MTHRVPKSRVGPDFAAAVAAHALEMRNWRAHMKRVGEDEKNGVTDPLLRHVAYPRPMSHPMVEAAVNENDVADFEIVDDGPTPEQALAAKRNDLFAAVSRAEIEAIAMIVPPGKARSFAFRETDIRNTDAKAYEKPGVLAKAASAIGITKPADILAEIEKNRPAEDTKFLADQADRRRRVAAIERAAAQMHSDIEDLTLDTVDAWKMPPFPT